MAQIRISLCSCAIVVSCWLAPLSAAEPVIIADEDAPSAPQQPQLSIDDSGVVHLAYAIGDTTYYARSTDGGKSFAKSVSLPPALDISLGMRRGPRIAVAGDAVCISVIGGRQGKGRDGDLLAFKSAGDGRSWQGPFMVNDVAGSAREGLHAMAAGAGGKLCSVWLDLRAKGTQIWSATSEDSGETWSKNVLVYKSPDGSVCECCHPSVTFDQRGNIHVLWRNALAGARDMYVATSADGGKSFGAATKLGTGSWPLEACPMDGGALAASADAKLASVWRRDKTVYLASSIKAKEEKLGEGEQPWLAATADGPAAVWLTKRGGSLMVKTPGKSAIMLAENCSDPVIAASPKGVPVLVAWEHQEGSSTQIVCQRLGK
jgi:hypothetical protein